jgi:hypothetical protein
MRKFYEDREESFTKPIKKKNKKLMCIIFLYLVLIFLISLLPLVFASIQSPQRLFEHLYFLPIKSGRIGFGTSIITKFPFTIFLSDIFFGGFKPTIYYVEKDKPLILFEFSDSLSSVDNLNLFYDTQPILKVFDDGFKQTYTKDGKILMVKTVKILSNYISFNFTFVESKNFNLTFFSPHKLSLENNFLKIDREKCTIKLKLNSTKDKILVSQNTFQLIGSAEKEIVLSLSVAEQDCIEKGIYDSLPAVKNFKIFFVYPLIALLGITLLWWKYEYR